MAFGIELAALPVTHVAGPVDGGQQRIVGTYSFEFGEIAAFGRIGPGADHLQHARPGRAAPKFELQLSAAQLPKFEFAKVVTGPLEVHDPQVGGADGGGYLRQVFAHQLILQGARASGHHHPFAGKQSRGDIGKRLAGSGAGFNHQDLLVGNRIGDRGRHLRLAGARLEPAPQGSGDGAARRKERRQGLAQGVARWLRGRRRVLGS